MARARRTRTAATHKVALTGHRTLHLVDLENLIYPSRPTLAVAAAALRAYRAASGWVEGDQVVVAANATLAFAAGVGWPGARVVATRGVDGADLALLDAADPAWVAQRFSRLVVASGDGIFTPLVTDCRRRGVAVHVIATPSTVAARLRAAVTAPSATMPRAAQRRSTHLHPQDRRVPVPA